MGSPLYSGMPHFLLLFSFGDFNLGNKQMLSLQYPDFSIPLLVLNNFSVKRRLGLFPVFPTL